MIICEEAAFIDPVTYYNIIIPLLTVASTAWINISTVSPDKYNHFSDLLKNDFIKQLQVTLVCDACKRMGIMNQCTHRMHDLPKWTSEYARSVVKRIYGDHHQEQHLRETMGVDDQVGPECFNSKRVDKIFLGPRTPLPNKYISHVFVAIDPCAGSQDREKAGSDYAVVSIIAPGTTIVGAEALDVCSPEGDYEDRIIQHFRQLFSKFKDATAIVAFESNSGHHTALSRRLLSTFVNRIVLLTDKELRKGGVTTTHKIKQHMMEMTQTAIIHDEVCVSAEFITSHAEPAKMLEEFRAQMLRYRAHKKPASTPFGQDKVAWSGKDGGRKDDLAVTLQLAIYWRSVFWTELKYKMYW